MKTLVLGDIHARDCWIDILEKESPDKVIFMGDYVSTHDKVSEEHQCKVLDDILNFKENNPDKVVLLRGNHDTQHLGYVWAQCSGYFPKVFEHMVRIEKRFLDLTQWVYIQDGLIFSHAGISKDFWDYLGIGEPTEENILKINNLEPSKLFGFTPNHFSDCYGDSVTQPLTWIRPEALLVSHLDGWGYVVGHTRMPHKLGDVIVTIDDDVKKRLGITMTELWFVDALPEHYMVIEDGVKRMVKNE